MQALLKHSQTHFVALPRRVRSRTHSRASPYPRQIASPAVSTHSRASSDASSVADAVLVHAAKTPAPVNVLRPRLVDPNMAVPSFVVAAKGDRETISAGKAPEENVEKPVVRPRVTANTRRPALASVKRAGKPSDKKENVLRDSKSNGPSMQLKYGPPSACIACADVRALSGKESLRIARPRPQTRNRPAPARTILV
jgi:serine/arginine repetitive matrix protein 2